MKIIDREREYFRKFIITVFIYVNIYAVLYLVLSAKFSAFLLITTSWIMTPVILFFKEKNYLKMSKMLFVISCLLYVLATPLGIHEKLNIEYYFLAALTLPAFLFKAEERSSIFWGMFFCGSAWVYFSLGAMPDVPIQWTPRDFPVEFFQVANFLGAFVIMVIFMHFFVDRYHKAAQKLQKLNDRLDNILESAALGGWEWDLEENTVYFDSRWCQILGMNFENVKQDFATWESRIHPEDQGMIKEHLHSYLEGHSDFYEVVYRLSHENGTWIWVLSRGKITKRNDLGKPLYFMGVNYNITKYKEAEILSLDIQGIAKIGGWELDSVSGDMIWTAETYHIYEISNNVPMNRSTILLCFSSYDQERMDYYLSNCLKGESFREIFTLIDKKGVSKLVEMVGKPQFNSQGTVFKIRGTIQDITENQNKDYELRQTLLAIERSADVVVTDKAGRIITANDNFYKISGYERNEILGCDHRVINSGKHSKEFFKNMWSTILSGKIWSGEIENKRKDGSAYFVQTVISPLADIEGKIQRFLAIRFDVTKQKVSERLLEEAQSSAKIGSWSYHVKTQNVEWSRQMYKLFSRDPGKGVPDRISHLKAIHPEDQKHWIANVEECIATGGSVKMRYRCLLPDGGFSWLETFCKASQDSHGATESISGTCQDVTELVLAENLAKQERAKALHNSKLASLGEMSAGIAHEINNPLGIITGATWNLSKYINDPEKFNNRVMAIEKAADRISKIVNSLRKFSRSSEKVEFRDHSLASIVNEAVVLTAAKSTQNATPVYVDARTDGQIFCDEIEIEQVLVNLINNGIDAVKKNQEKWIKIFLFEEEGKVILQVMDSGSGLPIEVQKNLFQPFFTTKSVGEGTGLGLSIVKGIIEEHKATIEVLTNSAHTCFEIKFPKVI